MFQVMQLNCAHFLPPHQIWLHSVLFLESYVLMNNSNLLYIIFFQHSSWIGNNNEYVQEKDIYIFGSLKEEMKRGEILYLVGKSGWLKQFLFEKDGVKTELLGSAGNETRKI